MVDVKQRTATKADGAAGKDGAPRQAPSIQDIRTLLPPQGLPEYWYPAMEDKQVKSKPVGLKMLGTDLVFFRGGDGQVKCLWNVCPHRGGSLMHGDCHFPGTISCPYHGWTYDGDGNVLAVLPEGPESKIPGTVKARTYPTRTLKGMVFVWMGEGEPESIEEDVPPEFFDAHTMMLYATEHWQCNWLVALENGADAHVPYVHRNAVRTLLFFLPQTGPVVRRSKPFPGQSVIAPQRYAAGGQRYRGAPDRSYFPALDAYWPKHRWRKLWKWMFKPAAWRHARQPLWECPEEWQGGHHLPNMFRSDHKTDMYTRSCVPVEMDLSRQIYFKAVRPKSWVGRLYERVHHRLYGRWMQVTNFSNQDRRAVEPQRFDTPEYLSATDSHTILWRRLLLQARGMMRPEEAQAVADTPAEEFSFRRQEEAGNEPERFTPV